MCVSKSGIIGPQRRTLNWAWGLVWLITLSLASGCSVIRLAYANGPQLAWWWLDGYMDFSRDQSVGARRAIDRWFDWHRPSQLPDYAALLAQAQTQMLAATTPAQVCAWQDRVRRQLEPALQRGLLEFADLVPSLGEAQFKHLEQRYLKGNDELRNDFLQPDSAERQRESIKRSAERAERLYGSLSEAQLQVIAAGVSVSPFNPELWLAERQRRQRDTLQTLRRLVADKPERDQRVGALRALVQRSEQSADPAYRAYQTRLGDYNCNLAAQLHNATTGAQRQKARDQLKAWEDDLRSLLTQPPT